MKKLIHIALLNAIFSLPILAMQSENGPRQTAPIHAAVKSGMLEEVKKILQEKSATWLNARDEAGKTPLHLALAIGKKNHRAIVEFILSDYKNYIDPNKQDDDGNTIIHTAFNAPFSQHFLPQLIKLKDIDLNKQNKKGNTALHEALIHNQEALAHAFIKDPRVNLKIGDNEGNTPLHLAVNSNVSPSLVRAFVEKDPTLVNLKNNAGDTPLHLLIETMNRDSEYEKIVKSAPRRNADEQAEREKSARDRLAADKEAMTLLFTKDIEPLTRNKAGKAPLDLADNSFTKVALNSLLNK